MLNTNYIPIVVEQHGQQERVFDIYSRLLRERIVFITGAINDYMSSIVTAQLLYLDAEDPNQEIFVYINSPGGVITSGLAIYDTMKFIRPQVSTLCIGQAASMGAILLAAGTPGKRFALPNARVMIHQPSGGFQGQATDFEIHALEILKLKQLLIDLFAEDTKQNPKKVKVAMERDNFLNAEEAKDMGIVDKIIKTRKKIKKTSKKSSILSKE